MDNRINLERVVIEQNNKLALGAKEGLRLPLEVGRFYKFTKRGYLIFPIGKKIPLVESDKYGEPKLASQIATIELFWTTQQILGGNILTSGEYIVKEIK